EAGLMERRAVSPETLAAQALGEVDLASGGLAPVINPATNYEREPDGSYRQDRAYTPADNPTFEHPERPLAGAEGRGCAVARAAPARCSRRGWRRPPRCSSPCCPVIMCWYPGFCIGGCGNGWPSSPWPGAWMWNSLTPPIRTWWRRRSARGGPGCCGWKRRRTPCGRSPTWRWPARSRTLPGPGWRWITRLPPRC